MYLVNISYGYIEGPSSWRSFLFALNIKIIIKKSDLY